MSDLAIRAAALGKLYQLGQQRGPYKTLRESITGAFTAPLRAMRRRTAEQKSQDELWALREVSFEVKKGEVVGIIGRNGAGKSTLLKILSRITPPSEGKVEIYGRVGSLLEVGTGFHPELSGRENIYLNGAILGMRKAEVERKFDEIVGFAEVQKFIDTPVKRYSSGMYMRLAFAVAAHLEPEVLVVDEVLAVGDAAFQKKCLGKMGDVAHEGRTVLLVSHNMVAIQQLCTRCVWIDRGEVKKIGPAREVVDEYSAAGARAAEGDFSRGLVKGDGRVELLSYAVNNARGQAHPLPVTNEDINIRIRLRVKEAIDQPACGISIRNERGVHLTTINTVEQGVVLPPLPAGESDLNIRLANVPYLPGMYTATLVINNPQWHVYARADDAITFEIEQSPLYGTTQVDHTFGCVFTKVEFSVGGVKNRSG